MNRGPAAGRSTNVGTPRSFCRAYPRDKRRIAGSAADSTLSCPIRRGMIKLAFCKWRRGISNGGVPRLRSLKDLTWDRPNRSIIRTFPIDDVAVLANGAGLKKFRSPTHGSPRRRRRSVQLPAHRRREPPPARECSIRVPVRCSVRALLSGRVWCTSFVAKRESASNVRVPAAAARRRSTLWPRRAAAARRDGLPWKEPMRLSRASARPAPGQEL